MTDTAPAVRRRPGNPSSPTASTRASSAPSSPPSRTSTTAGTGEVLLDLLRLLIGLLLLSSLLSYFVTRDSWTWRWDPPFLRPRVVRWWWHGPLHLTDEQLALHNGTDLSRPLLLALNGTIYDVSAGRRLYGPGGAYHVLAGVDAARAYVTGCFREDATPDLRGVEWAYVPRDVGRPGEGGDREAKVYREREVRRARRRVEETLRGWQRMFEGHGGKGYVEVGSVKRGEGWLERLPRRELCEQAERARPETARTEVDDPGRKYRGG